jgi:hypothetical protein
MLTVFASRQDDGSVSVRRSDGSHWVTYAWWRRDKPDRRCRRLTLNCFVYRLVWEAA